MQGWIAILFLLFVFLTGGGSRSDIASLPILRGVSVLFACWAITGMTRDDWRRILAPLAILLVLTTWIAIQLIPLAPSIWHALPGRETIVMIDRLLGQPELWRPISLTPSDTWNSLLAMTVPLAALLVAARLGAEDMARVMQALVIIAVASSLLGLLQIVSGSGSAAFLYRITNYNSMVGLFANRNHHAVFQACAVVFAAALLRDELMRRQQNPMIQLGLAAAAILCVTMTMLIGSRAGLVAGGVAFLIGYAMILSAWRGRPVATPRRRVVSGSASFGTQWLVYTPPVLIAALLATILFLAGRTTSLSRLADNRAAEDLRVLAWPTVWQMTETYWGVGAGFGSFPDVYKIFEVDALLQPAYFNHAHNDWMEALITGGLPFALIVAAGLIWFGRAAAWAGFTRLVKGHRGDYRLPVLAVAGLLAAASLVDYPLRTPSLQAMVIMLLVLFVCPAPATARRE
ncbi:O-antigen ligase [Sphingopyxis sp. DBS4]|uniref:O-antigen ligase family protein n=1 Tax=Sphingopyxis sp. DBS4 TaxID=2968500 RepID=UPI00214CD700|nr:O-antigen ligase family protein [Sphingopyxis sp. DBS4]